MATLEYDVAVDPFNVRTLKQARTYMLLGKRNTGKTTLLTDLCFHRQTMEFGIVFAGSIGSREDIKKYHPDTFIYEKFSADRLKTFFKDVKRMNGKLRRRNQQMVDCYLIIDDTGFDTSMWMNKTLVEIMQNGRHYNISLFICLQYGKALRPNMRSQVDYVFILKEKAPEMINKIWDCFAGGHFKSKKQFTSTLDKCTRDFRCLVIKNADVNEDDGDFNGSVYFYKAKKEHHDFRIGCDAMWEEHYRQYNEHYETDEENAGSDDEDTNTVVASSSRSVPKVTLNKRIRRA